MYKQIFVFRCLNFIPSNTAQGSLFKIKPFIENSGVTNSFRNKIKKLIFACITPRINTMAKNKQIFVFGVRISLNYCTTELSNSGWRDSFASIFFDSINILNRLC